MSTDWIKMRVDLRTHPKVVRMSSALKADKLRVIGGLFAVWAIFDAHSDDGVLEGYTFRAVDDELNWKGFAQAMSAIGWLEVTADDGLSAPRFEDHNGQSAKRRAMESARKASNRTEQDDRTKSERIADWKREKDGQMSASDADKKRSREEKRREEERNTGKLSLAPALPPEDRPPPVRAETDSETPKPWEPPNCPHGDVLALWAEVLPAMPQHLPSQWRGARADHLRARWRETAAEKRWQSPAEGLAYLRKLFAYCGQSPFLTGRAVQRDTAKRPFVMELEWLVTPGNWAKVIEGKYHQETAA